MKRSQRRAREGSSEWLPDDYRSLQRHYQLRNGRELVCDLEKYRQLHGTHLVDLGSGTGELTEEIRRKVGESGRVLGVDADVGMVARARERSGCEFVAADFREWLGTQNDGRWDIVFSNAALHWLESIAELKAVLSDVKRISRSRSRGGGLLAARFSLCENGASGKDLLESVLREFYGSPSRVHRSPFAYHGSIRTVEEAGFRLLMHRRRQFRMFKDTDMEIAWILKSQPLARYVDRGDMERFKRACADAWHEKAATLWADHVVIIAERDG
jgi:ubiquinone/menaquinone biosynthesis C-methylase UbiE